jgi:hypothetical protein
MPPLQSGRKGYVGWGPFNPRGDCLIGPVSDTENLLRGVSSSARESFYRKSSSRYFFYGCAIVLLLSVAVVGLLHGDFLGHVVALGGAFGIALVSIWLCLR